MNYLFFKSSEELERVRNLFAKKNGIEIRAPPKY